MPRRIDRDARKEQLGEALWRVVRQRGVGAVSVRTVAEEAGVVVGSLRHVFPTRAELIEFSAELMVQRATGRILATPRNDDPVAYGLALLTHLLPLAPDSRAELEVNLALIAEAPAVPSLASIRDHAAERIEELCLQIATLLTGRVRDDRLVRTGRRLSALVDGLALHLLAAPHAADPAWALDLLREELVRIRDNA